MPLFHLGGIQISLMTMLSGGKIVLPKGRFDPIEVLGLMEKERIRSWGSVPTMVSRVVQHPDFSRVRHFERVERADGRRGHSEVASREVEQAFPNRANGWAACMD